MTPSSSTAIATETAGSTINAEPALLFDATVHPSAGQSAPPSADPSGAKTAVPESAKLHTVRGLNGWTLYCIEDGDSSGGVAVIEQETMLTNDLLVGGWSLGGDEATILRLTLHGGASFSASFAEFIRESLSGAAIRQLASLGVDAFELC